MSTEQARVVVLAEPEAFFLPHCIARLAVVHRITAIVEVQPPALRATLRKGWNTFGPAALVSIAASEALARVVDRVSPNRFYSLRKVARRFGIPYEQVSGLHEPDCLAAIDRHRPDFVFAQVSRRIRPVLLARARFVNKHCSLLPGYAGVFPIFWALLHGEPELGVTVHEMDEEFDRGPILQQAAIPSGGHSFFSAYHSLYDRSPELLDRAFHGEVGPHRPGRPSYFGFPGEADRAAFRAAGRRFGTPFRLHDPVSPRQDQRLAESRSAAVSRET